MAVSSGLGVEVMPAASSEVGAEPEGMAAISGGSRESIKIFSSKVDTESVGGADVDDACDDKTEAVTHSSSVTSGLSSSGESLTDVSQLWAARHSPATTLMDVLLFVNSLFQLLPLSMKHCILGVQ